MSNRRRTYTSGGIVREAWGYILIDTTYNIENFGGYPVLFNPETGNYIELLELNYGGRYDSPPPVLKLFLSKDLLMISSLGGWSQCKLTSTPKVGDKLLDYINFTYSTEYYSVLLDNGMNRTKFPPSIMTSEGDIYCMIHSTGYSSADPCILYKLNELGTILSIISSSIPTEFSNYGICLVGNELYAKKPNSSGKVRKLSLETGTVTDMGYTVSGSYCGNNIGYNLNLIGSRVSITI